MQISKNDIKLYLCENGYNLTDTVLNDMKLYLLSKEYLKQNGVPLIDDRVKRINVHYNELYYTQDFLKQKSIELNVNNDFMFFIPRYQDSSRLGNVDLLSPSITEFLDSEIAKQILNLSFTELKERILNCSELQTKKKNNNVRLSDIALAVGFDKEQAKVIEIEADYWFYFEDIMKKL